MRSSSLDVIVSAEGDGKSLPLPPAANRNYSFKLGEIRPPANYEFE